MKLNDAYCYVHTLFDHIECSFFTPEDRKHDLEYLIRMLKDVDDIADDARQQLIYDLIDRYDNLSDQFSENSKTV